MPVAGPSMYDFSLLIVVMLALLSLDSLLPKRWILCSTPNIESRSRSSRVIAVTVFVEPAEPLRGARLPASVAVVEEALGLAADPAGRQILERQTGVDVRESAPLVNQLGVGDEDVPVGLWSHGLDLVDEGPVAVLEVGQVPGGGDHPSWHADRAGERGERNRVLAETEEREHAPCLRLAFLVGADT